MYLVPKRLYDSFIQNSSEKAVGLVKQINNLDVNQGGQVVINSDCNQKRDVSTLQRDVSTPLLISNEEDQIINKPQFTEETEVDSSPEENESISNSAENQSSLKPLIRDSTSETSFNQNNIEDEKTTKIIVLDEDGVKIPKEVQSSKISNLDWVDSESQKEKDIFVSESDLKMKRGRRKNFNRKYVSAPSFLKRNLTPQIMRDIVTDNGPLKIKEKIMKPNPPIDSSRKEIKPNAENVTPITKEPVRLKVNVINDDDVDMMSEKKGVKRKQNYISDGPKMKETKEPINIRKRSIRTIKNDSKKMKLDWE